MAQAYRVCAPYVTVRVKSPTGGETMHGFYEGGVLPESAVRESVESLLVKGMIEATDAPTPEEQAARDAKANKKAADAAEANSVRVAEEDAQKKADKDKTPPHGNASQAVWVDFAVRHRGEGVSEERARAEAQNLSKDQLVAKYGKR